MAAATSVTRYMTVNGPIKTEYITCTMAASADDVETRMQRPLFVFAMTNSTGNANAIYSISGKTITITDADISASTVNLMVVGF